MQCMDWGEALVFFPDLAFCATAYRQRTLCMNRCWLAARGAGRRGRDRRRRREPVACLALAPAGITHIARSWDLPYIRAAAPLEVMAIFCILYTVCGALSRSRSRQPPISRGKRGGTGLSSRAPQANLAGRMDAAQWLGVAIARALSKARHGWHGCHGWHGRHGVHEGKRETGNGKRQTEHEKHRQCQC